MTTIDEAARAAGRDPAEVTRLLNVGGEATADDLVRLAVEDGVSTFIVMGDDEGGLRRFAGLFDEVRERVAEARSASGTKERSRVRGPAALARRLPGIAYDDLPAALAERAVEPGDAAYARYRSGYLRGGAPGLALRPRTVPEVQEAVAFAREHRELPLGRSGWSARSRRPTSHGCASSSGSGTPAGCSGTTSTSRRPSPRRDRPPEAQEPVSYSARSGS